MNASALATSGTVDAAVSGRRAAERYFFAAAASVVLVTTILGFHHFYFEGRAWPGRPLTPQIRGLVLTHGLGMTAWLLLMVLQPLLVARRAVSLHKKLGWAAAALGVALVPLAFTTAILGTRLTAPDPAAPFTPQQFLAEPMLVITGFALFVAAGVWQRRNARAHRALLLMGTMLVASAGPARLDAWLALYTHTPFMAVFGDMFATVLIGLLVLGAHRVVTGRFDGWLAGAFAAMCIWIALVNHTITAAWWVPVSSWLLA
ncbi:MAG TPA: hypothetical protein VG734_20995 [Lacunisphaera sp.]|nr:hypothetical protein [Lacunisphaera sp.]